MMRQLRDTTSHYMNALSAMFTPDDLDKTGGALAKLIDGQASTIASEYGNDLVDWTWLTLLTNLEDIDAREHAALCQHCADMILLQASGFNWRVLKKLTSRPLVLLKMAKDLRSTETSDIAFDLLHAKKPGNKGKTGQTEFDFSFLLK